MPAPIASGNCCGIEKYRRRPHFQTFAYRSRSHQDHFENFGTTMMSVSFMLTMAEWLFRLQLPAISPGRAVVWRLAFLQPNRLSRRGVARWGSGLAHGWMNRQIDHFLAISQAVEKAMISRDASPQKITVVFNEHFRHRWNRFLDPSISGMNWALRRLARLLFQSLVWNEKKVSIR